MIKFKLYRNPVYCEDILQASAHALEEGSSLEKWERGSKYPNSQEKAAGSQSNHIIKGSLVA